ncbi:alpha-tocopherol transfer protein-like [Pieris rapae]|uniref:alpha-tocopherol transfer protein-like n=1 Tax=Pieris rapae TaxID=64459 RepID=UPI001E27FBAA|nr:alpha-tocopherol transfer protein-like [Pieris rapae]
MALYYEDGTPYVLLGGHRIQLEREPFTEEYYVKKAEKELRETPENVENGLRELRELLKGELNLIVPIEDDVFLMKFLRPCKFYADSAFKRIKAYYKFRLLYANYCKDLTPRATQAAFQNSIVSMLSPRDKQGRRLLFVESGELWKPRVVPLGEMFRGVQIALESALEEPRTQVSGVNVVINLKGLSLSHIMHFTPSFAKMIVDWIQDCIPVRLKGVHIINQPYIFNMLFALFKPFLSTKLRSRIHFHGSDTTLLLKDVDASQLVERCGGTLPESEETGDVMWKMLCHYEEDFKTKISHGYVDNNNKC